MNDEQVFCWLSLLPGRLKNRRQIIRNLLDHAGEDAMGSEDRAICIRALELTTGQERDYHVGVQHRLDRRVPPHIIRHPRPAP